MLVGFALGVSRAGAYDGAVDCCRGGEDGVVGVVGRRACYCELAGEMSFLRPFKKCRLEVFRRRRQVVEVDVVLDEPRCESGASAASEVEKCRADECFKGVSAEEAVVRLYVFGEIETLRQSDGV